MSDHGRNPHAELGRDLARRLEERDERTRRAHAAAAEVTGLPAAERPGSIRSHPDCLEPAFIELMIAIARERRGPAPEESVAYAHLAAAAAEAAHAAGRDVDDARALAFAELGNAHRICGDLRRAGIAFGLARERARYAADPLVRAEVDSLEASYRDYCNDFAGAERLLRRAERIERRLGTPHGVGRVRLKLGNIAQGRGDLEAAIALYRAALDLVDPAEEPRLVMVGIHNLASCSIDAGQHDAALSLLRRHRSLFESAGSAADRALVGWLEARAARTAGLLELAEATFEEARDQFVSLRRPYETGLVLLELAEIYAVGKRWSELEKVAAATLTLCRANGIASEGVAAAMLLCTAARRRQETTEGIARLVAAVRDHLSPPATGNRPTNA